MLAWHREKSSQSAQSGLAPAAQHRQNCSVPKSSSFQAKHNFVTENASRAPQSTVGELHFNHCQQQYICIDHPVLVATPSPQNRHHPVTRFFDSASADARAGAMTDKLPPNLLALFAPRPPLRWVEAPDYAPEKRRTAAIEGVAGYLSDLKNYRENDDSTPTESWLEARDRKKLEKKAALEDLSNNVSSYCMLRLGYYLIPGCIC